jgi:flagellar motor switch protein FliM
VVRLDAMAGDDTTVYADAVPVHRARAGRSGSRRAIQILGPFGEETR